MTQESAGASSVTMSIDPGVIREIARTPSLLVCCDYDGTLAPIVGDPARALPLPEAVGGLRAMSQLPATTVAVVSGRALRDLAALSRLPSEIHLVGSHGSEFDWDFGRDLSADQVNNLAEIDRQARELVSAIPGALLEHKPAGIAVHVRGVEDSDEAEALIERVEQVAGGLDGVWVRHGKKVVELSVVHSDKAEAVALLRHRLGASAVLFIGDDLTDESVFAELSGPDVGVKVGPGDTRAAFRVEDPHAVALLLADVLAERQRWLLGGHAHPIEDYTLLADGRTVALLSARGGIDWFCAPDPDSPALFASLLGDATAGHFTIRPVTDNPPMSTTYLKDTMIAHTRWAGLTVTDFADGGPGLSPDAHGVIRLVRIISGSTPARVEFCPRPQFFAVPVTLQVVPGGLVVQGASDAICLSAPGVEWQITEGVGGETATAIIDASTQDVRLELRYGTDDVGVAHIGRSLEEVEQAWRSWASAITPPGIDPAWEKRSALTLKGLCFAPTGGVLAAATTSLPEGIGGLRNWDYRYVWIRDAALTVRALVDVGSLSEAEAYLQWLHDVVAAATSPERLHPLYSIYGTELGPEAVLDHLPGYAGSRPVRVGNAAQGQVQLDVFGPVVALVDEVSQARGTVTDVEWQLVVDCVTAVSHRWTEPDHGIWEIRDHPRHHVHSRMMCWLAAHRGARVAQRRGITHTAWIELAELIVADIEMHGFDTDQNAYVCAYDRRVADAAVLQGLLEGYPAPHERIAGTVAYIEKYLRRSGGVYRYLYDDGLSGHEGAMHICGAWLAAAYVRLGQLDHAHQMLTAMSDAAGVTDLLPEQVDPLNGGGLGNHPQAYSHLGALVVARELSRASR
jgi:trehalose 6-phosphate phosphatase